MSSRTGGESPFPRGAGLQASGSPRGGRECSSEKEAANRTPARAQVRARPALQGEACLGQQTQGRAGQPEEREWEASGRGPAHVLVPVSFPVRNITILRPSCIVCCRLPLGTDLGGVVHTVV